LLSKDAQSLLFASQKHSMISESSTWTPAFYFLKMKNPCQGRLVTDKQRHDVLTMDTNVIQSMDIHILKKHLRKLRVGGLHELGKSELCKLLSSYCSLLISLKPAIAILFSDKVDRQNLQNFAEGELDQKKNEPLLCMHAQCPAMHCNLKDTSTGSSFFVPQILFFAHAFICNLRSKKWNLRHGLMKSQKAHDQRQQALETLHAVSDMESDPLLSSGDVDATRVEGDIQAHNTNDGSLNTSNKVENTAGNKSRHRDKESPTRTWIAEDGIHTIDLYFPYTNC
jgi:hypothetical protein